MSFWVPAINYLGFIVVNDEIKSQEDKISAILSTPCPDTKKSLRSFRGLTSFYRK